VKVDRYGWRLYVFQRSDRGLARQLGVGALIGFLASGLACLGGFALYRSRQRALASAAMQEDIRLSLERRVAERTQELTTAHRKLLNEAKRRRRTEDDLSRLRDDLVQANKLAVLGQVAAGVAHEVNQPLTAMMTYVDSAQLLLQKRDLDAASHNLTVVGRLIGRARTIVSELLAFSRRAPSAVETVSLDNAIAGAMAILKHKIPSQRLSLRAAYNESDLLVLAQPVRLEQVLVNLLQNSLEALEDRRGGKIEIKVEADEKWITVLVQDNGPGISSSLRKRLFMPFSSSKKTGLGLGLLIAKELTEGMGGKLELASTSHEGTCFSVKLVRKGRGTDAEERAAAGKFKALA
jgi:two-component system C4-dicarboxylate transport sensor histidine kinase DctB